MENEIAWEQKFEIFEKSYALFKRMLTYYNKNPYSEVGQMALIHSYRVNVKSALDLMDVYINSEYFKIGSEKETLTLILLSEIFKGDIVSIYAFSITTDARKITSFIYNKKDLDFVLKSIIDEYKILSQQIYEFFKGKIDLLTSN